MKKLKSKYKVGQVVQLQSGSVPMTITAVDLTEEECYYKVNYFRYKRKLFLRKVFYEYMNVEDYPESVLKEAS